MLLQSCSKRLHPMRRIHKEGIWLPHEMSENVILNCLSIATSLSSKEHRVFCGVSWLAMTNGFILIFPSGKYGWIPANRASMAKRNIHGNKTFLCIWWDQESALCCKPLRLIMQSLQLIATNSNYANWVMNWCKKDHLYLIKSFCYTMTLDRILRKAWSKHFYNLNGKSSSIQYILQTWHRRIMISSDRCNTHLRT